jgi:hypothetical protein
VNIAFCQLGSLVVPSLVVATLTELPRLLISDSLMWSCTGVLNGERGEELVPPPLVHVTLDVDFSDIEPRLSR